MNTRLLDYLRSLGLSREASSEDAWTFYSARNGINRSIANCLNYNENDQQARTNCDLSIRALGYNPDKPSEILTPEPVETRTATAELTPTQPGNDGASNQGDLEAARTEAATQERSRQDRIRELAFVSGVTDELLRTAIDGGHSVERAQTDFLSYFRENNRAPAETNGSPAPAGHIRNSQTGFSGDSLAAALMLRNGINDPTQQWARYDNSTGQVQIRNVEGDDALNRSIDQGNAMRHLSMVEIVRRCLAIDGIQCEPHHRSVINAMQHRAAMGTATLVGAFSQVFGAMLLQSFQEAPDTTAGWVIERDNPNFFANERTRMGKVGALTKHGRGQTAESVDFSDSTEPVKVNRYSGLFTIDEIDLVNDTFGALADFTPAEMGAAAARIRPDLVYSILLSNPDMRDGNPLFDAAHSNTVTGALDKATLQSALTLIAVQQERGVNLNLAGRYVIVSQASRFDARELLGSATVVITGPADVVRPSNNALSAEDLSLVSDARIDNGVTDPNSGVVSPGDDQSWFVAAPASQHTIEATYLAGSSRSPEIRSKILEHGQWGIGFDVKQDIGAKALSWEGLVAGNS